MMRTVEEAAKKENEEHSDQIKVVRTKGHHDTEATSLLRQQIRRDDHNHDTKYRGEDRTAEAVNNASKNVAHHVTVVKS